MTARETLIHLRRGRAELAARMIRMNGMSAVVLTRDEAQAMIAAIDFLIEDLLPPLPPEPEPH